MTNKHLIAQGRRLAEGCDEAIAWTLRELAQALELATAPPRTCEKCGKEFGKDKDAYCAGHGQSPAPLPLDLSTFRYDEDWDKLATLNGTELRATLTMMAKAQASGDL